MRTFALTSILLAAFGLPTLGYAESAGDWTFKLGVHTVNPRSDNGRVAGTLDVDIDSATRLTVAMGRMLSSNLELEFFAGLPYRHEGRLNALASLELKHIPMALSLNYHFLPGEQLCPYAGLGVGFVQVYDERSFGRIAGTDLSLGNSWGLQPQFGVDYRLNAHWSLGFNARYFDFDSRARLNGAAIGTVNVDPWVIGVNAQYTF